MVDDDRFPLEPGEELVMRSIRLVPLALPLTGAVQRGATLTDVIQEMLLTTTSERQRRAIDKDQGASMKPRNSKGIFRGAI